MLASACSSCGRGTPEEKPVCNSRLAEALLVRSRELKTRYHQTWLLEDVEERIRTIRNALTLMEEPTPLQSLTAPECITGEKRLTIVTVWLCLYIPNNLTLIPGFCKVTAAGTIISEHGPEDELPALLELSVALGDHYQHIGELKDLDEQIRTLQLALGTSPDDSTRTTLIKRELGAALRARFRYSGDTQDIHEAFKLHSFLLDQHVPSHPDYPWILYELGFTLYLRFEKLGDKNDFSRSIALTEEALQLIPDSDPWRYKAQQSLAMYLWMRYHLSGNLSDLDTSSAMHRELLSSQPSNHRDRVQTYSGLGMCMGVRYQQTNDMAYLNEAVECMQRAIDLQDSRNPNRARIVSNLAGSLRARYYQLGNICDLDEAIRLLQQITNFPPASHAAILCQLSNCLGGRYRILGTDDDLDESIELYRKALVFFPPGHPRREDLVLGNLADRLQDRYRRDRRPADASEAISLLRESVALRPQGSPGHIVFVTDLVEALCQYHEDFGRPDYLEEAIMLCESWMIGSQEKEGRDSHVSAKVMVLSYDFHRRTKDLDLAISLYTKALQLRPPGRIQRHESLVGLAQVLSQRFNALHTAADVETAMELLTDSLNDLPTGHPSRATSLFELARLHLVQETSDLSISTALEKFTRGITDRHQNAQRRLTSALGVLRYLEDQITSFQQSRQLRQALLDAYIKTVDLLPRVASFGLDIESRLRVLANSDKLAADGAAHALILAQSQVAVTLLEQGRAVFWSQHLRLRTTFNALPSDLATKLTHTAFMLERGSHSSSTNNKQTADIDDAKAAQEIETAKQRRLGDDFEALIAQARVLPGFERFMLPETFQALCSAAAKGPVVVLLATGITCQAIVIENPDSVHRVELPEMSLQSLQILSHTIVTSAQHGRELIRGRGMKKSRTKGDKKAEEVLAELWWTVIKRILVDVMHAKV